MCRTIYGIGLIVIRMREGYEGGVRGHMDEMCISWQKTAASNVELGWLSGLGLVLLERLWRGGHGFKSRLIFEFSFFFFYFRKFSKLFWWASLPVLKALSFRHSLILYNHLYSYLRAHNLHALNFIIQNNETLTCQSTVHRRQKYKDSEYKR